MESPPSSSDKVFNYLILRTIVGVIAIALAFLTWWIVNVYYADIDIPTSISITYHLGAQDVFVGCLFIVAAFFFSYLGKDNPNYKNDIKWQRRVSILGGLAAIVVALFPTQCEAPPAGELHWIAEVTNGAVTTCSIGIAGVIERVVGITIDTQTVQFLHTGAAILLIFVLLVFCMLFYQRPEPHMSDKQRLRQKIYWICAAAMLLAIAVAIYEGAYSYLNGPSYGSKTTFWVEFVCLTAFGIAWIVSGKQLLIIATPAEKAGKE